MGNEWDNDVEEKLEYLELFSNKKIELQEGSPAQLLQHLLEQKWKLEQGDKDMIVMQHQFEYSLKNKPNEKKILHSDLVIVGDNDKHTAMAKTVGLPLAICVKNFLTGEFKLSGVQIPIKKEIYAPLLQELEAHGITFIEQIIA
jgi:saccharopine dehydrogenase-like NADP-dependent oxidoreductase